MADITYTHREYDAALPIWTLIGDCVAGELAVKSKKDLYLPRPNPFDDSMENQHRYKQYLARAVFYNATNRTLQGLVGAAFRKYPEIEVSGIEYVLEDVDGAGVSIYQQSQSVTEAVLSKGRHILLVDYPMTAAPASRADMDSGYLRATISSLNAESVTYWRTARVGARQKIVEVRIKEYVIEVDGFGEAEIEQYRVLRLENNIYTQEIWRINKSGDWDLYQEPIVVRDSSGRAWDEIPIVFVGSNNNDIGVDSAPLYDLASLNIAHYRNSADYEDSAYLVGQAQVWMSGMDEHWIKMLQEQGIYLGSRSILPVPQSGAVGLIQAGANGVVKEAMDQKESQMVALGARLLTKGTAVKTATQAQGEQESEHSVLSLVVSNVSEAYTKCLEWMGRFMGASGNYEYEINREFIEQSLDAQMLTALVGAFQSGVLPDSDLWSQLRKYGLIDPEKDDDLLRGELENNGGLNLETLPFETIPNRRSESDAER